MVERARRKTVERESRGFRDRSARRSLLKKRSSKRGKPQRLQRSDVARTTTNVQTPALSSDTFLDPGIFRDCPSFITILLPQINGCWDRDWFEACALATRRLLETLIVHLYETRGWASEIKTVDGYMKLQNLVDKVSATAE